MLSSIDKYIRNFKLIPFLQGYESGPRYAPYETFFVRAVLSGLICYLYRDCPLDQAHPRGLSMFVDLQPLCTGNIFIYQRLLMFVFCILYTFRIWPILSSSFIAFNFIATNTVYNSYAIFHGNQILGQIILVRAIGHIYFGVQRLLRDKGYILSGVSEEEEESRLVRWSQEAMAGAYFASVITKMVKSDGQWLFRAHCFVMDAIATRERAYYWGELPTAESSSPEKILGSLLKLNPVIPQVVFSGGFFTELFAPLFLYNRWTLLFGGIMIFQMHYFIEWIMSLTFGVNMILATTFFINPVYWAVTYWPAFARFFSIFTRLLPKLFSTHPPEGDIVHRQKPTSILGRIAYVWHRIPFKLLIVLVIMSLFLKEFFPLSHWPMYANPQPYVSFLHLRDKDNNPLMPAGEYLRSSMSKIHKHYRAICKELWGENANWLGNNPRETKCGNETLYSILKFSRSSKREELKSRMPFSLIKTHLTLNQNMDVNRRIEVVGIIEQMPPKQHAIEYKKTLW
eukprot:TRINITY_DN10047_c0_g1_i1.p1 TRINITY_DN10047_c0_g1~~TRINITY_DN10047_c0_g1_i1.p1  ORF type:complete len:511 (-),score=68.15 TRINITY_DN10047_c0_g1_i1:115-1647(-)